MKKVNRKILFMLISAIISVTMLAAVPVNAVSTVAALDNITYTYEGISAEKAEQAVKTIYGISNGAAVQPFSILCWFGHSTQTGMFTATEHNYYSTAPRCKQTISNVDVCTRSGCDYITVRSQTVSRVGCH